MSSSYRATSGQVPLILLEKGNIVSEQETSWHQESATVDQQGLVHQVMEQGFSTPLRQTQTLPMTPLSPGQQPQMKSQFMRRCILVDSKYHLQQEVIPTPSETQILLRVLAVPLTIYDLPFANVPTTSDQGVGRTPGIVCLGRVDAVGEQARKLLRHGIQVNSLVLAFTASEGALSDWICVSAKNIHPLALEWQEDVLKEPVVAASLAEAAYGMIQAYQCFYRLWNKVHPGDKVLICDAVGSVGSCLIQMSLSEQCRTFVLSNVAQQTAIKTKTTMTSNALLNFIATEGWVEGHESIVTYLRRRTSANVNGQGDIRAIFIPYGLLGTPFVPNCREKWDLEWCRSLVGKGGSVIVYEVGSVSWRQELKLKWQQATSLTDNSAYEIQAQPRVLQSTQSTPEKTATGPSSAPLYHTTTSKLSLGIAPWLARFSSRHLEQYDFLLFQAQHPDWYASDLQICLELMAQGIEPMLDENSIVSLNQLNQWVQRLSEMPRTGCAVVMLNQEQGQNATTQSISPIV